MEIGDKPIHDRKRARWMNKEPGPPGSRKNLPTPRLWSAVLLTRCTLQNPRGSCPYRNDPGLVGLRARNRLLRLRANREALLVQTVFGNRRRLDRGERACAYVQ